MFVVTASTTSALWYVFLGEGNAGPRWFALTYEDVPACDAPATMFGLPDVVPSAGIAIVPWVKSKATYMEAPTLVLLTVEQTLVPIGLPPFAGADSSSAEPVHLSAPLPPLPMANVASLPAVSNTSAPACAPSSGGGLLGGGGLLSGGAPLAEVLSRVNTDERMITDLERGSHRPFPVFAREWGVPVSL